MKDDISYVLVPGEDGPFPPQEGKMKNDISYVLVQEEDGPFPLQMGKWKTTLAMSWFRKRTAHFRCKRENERRH
jgi:hypothetical protein